MAGLGRRTFAPGEVLTATNVMGYLQDQAVMKFAGTAARGSAIGTAVAEGMVSYLADTDLVEVYNGTAWKQISASTGNILQVVYASTTTTVGNNTTSQADTTLSATITPKSASSKILVMTSQSIFKSSGNAENQVNLFLYRDASQIFQQAIYELATGSAVNFQGSKATNYLDSPASTSAITYKTRFSNYVSGSYVYVQQYSSPSTMILLEVAG